MSVEPQRWATNRSLHGGVHEIVFDGWDGSLWLCGKHFIGPDPRRAIEYVSADLVVCLCELPELRDRFPEFVEWLASPSEAVRWWPVPDLHAPELEEFVLQTEELSSHLRRGSTVLVHCGGGIGRAGTLATGILMTGGLSLPDAADRVRTCRPMAGPERGTQEELLRAFATRLEAT